MHGFVLCPNFCGSTLLHDLLRLSPDVACLPAKTIDSTDEEDGRQLGIVEPILYFQHPIQLTVSNRTKGIEGVMADGYKDANGYDWDGYKSVIEPMFPSGGKLKLQKDPQFSYMIPFLDKEFPSSKFVVMVRNPYQHVARLMYRPCVRKWGLESICKQATTSMRLLMEGYERLGDKAIKTTYEALVANPSQEIERICSFLEVDPPQIPETITVKGKNNRIESENVPLLEESIDDCYPYFKEHEATINYWGYQIGKGL